MSLKTASLLLAVIIPAIMIEASLQRSLLERIYTREFYHITEKIFTEEDMVDMDLLLDLKVQLCFGPDTDYKRRMMNAKMECNGIHWPSSATGRSLVHRSWRQQEFLEEIDYLDCFRESMGLVDNPDNEETLKDLVGADLATSPIATRLNSTDDTCWEKTQAAVRNHQSNITASGNGADSLNQEEIDAALVELKTRLVGSIFAKCVFGEIHKECFAEVRKVIVEAGILN